MDTSRGRSISARLVVKHTFLEFEVRGSLPDAPDGYEDAPKRGYRLRASSDSVVYESNNSSLEQDIDEARKLANSVDELPSADLLGASNNGHDADTESTASLTTSSSDDSRCSSRSTSSDQPRFGSPSQYNSDGASTLSQLKVESLANDNARLLLENMILQQQYMEFVKTYQQLQSFQQSACKKGKEARVQLDPPEKVAEVDQPERIVSTMAPPENGLFSRTALPASSYIFVPLFPVSLDVPSHEQASLAQSIAIKSSQEETSLDRNGTVAPRVNQTSLAAVSNARKPAALEHSFDDENVRESIDDEKQHQMPKQQCACPLHLRTTVMLRNLPNNYSRAMLLDLIDSERFANLYDFIYIPIDFMSKASLGYAFVNLTNHEAAKRFQATFDGFNNWILPSRKVCNVSWSEPHQGLEAHIERYRNSPIMHQSVSDSCKPAIFKDGKRVTFPLPTKKLQAPRARVSRKSVFPLLKPTQM